MLKVTYVKKKKKVIHPGIHYHAYESNAAFFLSNWATLMISYVVLVISSSHVEVIAEHVKFTLIKAGLKLTCSLRGITEVIKKKKKMTIGFRY